MARRFELTDGKSSKFWEVELAGVSLTVRFGRIGTNGQTQTKTFTNDAMAAAERDKLVREKTGKGYVEEGAAGPLAAVAPKAATPTATSAAAPAQSAGAAPPASPPTPVSGAAPPAPAAEAVDVDSATIHWTDELRRSIEGVRGISLPRAPIDPDATWARTRKGIAERRVSWDQFAGSGMANADLAAAALAIIDRAESPRVESVGTAAALLGIAAYGRDDAATEAALDWLVATHGVPFAFDAAMTTLAAWPEGAAPSLVARTAFGVGYSGTPVMPFEAMRAHVATASSADYDEVLAKARARWEEKPGALTSMALAYLLPGVDGWADELIAKDSITHCRLLTCARDPAMVTKCIHENTGYRLLTRSDAEGGATLVGGILACAGASLAVVRALFDLYDRLPGSDHKRGAAATISRVASVGTLAGLAARSRDKEVQVSLGPALARSPQLGLCALAEVALLRTPASDQVRSLLAGLIRAGVADAANLTAHLTPGAQKLIAELTAATATIAAAPAEDIPAVLRAPPWLASKKTAGPATVVIAPIPHDDAFEWPKGLPDAWPRDPWADHLTATLPDPSARLAKTLEHLALPVGLEASDGAIAAACAKPGKFRGYGPNPLGFAHLPDALAQGILRHMPSAHWSTHFALAGFGAAVVKLQLQITDIALRLAEHFAPQCLEIVLPYDVARAAPLVAANFALKKERRAIAERWLRMHPSAAIAGLLPLAIGPAGKAREQAEDALRFIASIGHKDALLAVAKGAGSDAEAATRAFLDRDPLDRFPAKLPKLPEFADPSRLPRPVVAAGDGRTGGALSAEATRHLLTMLAFSRLDEPYAGLALVREAGTAASLAAFAWDLFTAWLLAGASSKEIWAMNALGHIGDDECARTLAAKIREWPGEAAHARAVSGLEVLATLGTDVALMHLYGISEKVKFKGLQERAREKIALIAEQRGLSPDALADRLVPDLGLDDDGTMVLDFGPRSFIVTFDELLRPVVFDAQKKRLPDLPKPGKNDDATKAEEATQRFRALKKDAKTVASQLVTRLERAMCSRRRWDAATFGPLLAMHPVARHVVRRLAWATFDDADVARDVFRVAEDGTLADVHDDAWELPADARIGIAHALELRPADAAAMGQLFGDYEILQPFQQLGRETYAATELELAAAELTRGKGWTVPTGKVLGLEARGWRRGETQDGGNIEWMTKRVPGDLEARLALDPGIIVGMVSENPEQTLGVVELHREGAYQGSGTKMGDLDPIVLSELIRDLEGLRG